jgi:quinol monooxygenase YgiN
VSFVLVVHMTAQEGAEKRALEVMRELAAASRQEAGCEAYVPCQDPDDARSLVL